MAQVCAEHRKLKPGVGSSKFVQVSEEIWHQIREEAEDYGDSLPGRCIQQLAPSPLKASLSHYAYELRGAEPCIKCLKDRQVICGQGKVTN